MTLVSREASLGSFGLDMMMVVQSEYARVHQQRDVVSFESHLPFAFPGVDKYKRCVEDDSGVQ